MSIYFQKDIEVGLDGDLVISSRGDLTVADSPSSSSQLLKNMMATDLREIDTAPNFGANIGTMVGRGMDEALERIPVLVRDAIRRGNYFSQGDVFVDIYPIDIDKLMIFVDLKGSFIDEDGFEVAHPTGTIKFLFPYTKERLMEWTDD